ncbi:MAG: hypothetical protein M1821_001117 [Bathelium mastoideum]|nr:MAG: hypothetical protein M1821_001117 [Bathelium mastoideum]KAI9693856.1 MAG: hypothetical protein M1822_003127 [Bathelium mastoideum]
MSSSPNSQNKITLPSLPPEYDLLTTIPSLETYLNLRVASGLSPKSEAAALAGLPNTLHAVQIEHAPTNTIVGMGRIVGDNGLFYQVVDIGVHPAHQRKGLGKAIVGELMRWVEETGKGGGHVTLLADGDAPKLYRQFGFTETLPKSVSMKYRIPVRDAGAN